MNVAEPITIQEITKVLKGFVKSKSPGFDDWMVEFLLEFLDLIGLESLEIVEEYILLGFVSSVMNATFITLIAKKEKPETFNEFCPMSLCNLVYKVMSKIIASYLKPVLSKSMSK